MTYPFGPLFVALVLLLPIKTDAQPPGGEPAIFRELYPPELVMEHQRELKLTPEQREAITGAIKGMQGEVLDLQWQMQDEMKKLGELLRAERVDESGALAQAEKLMTLEQKIKKHHLTLLIRIKNELDAVQQQKLRELRPEEPFRRPGPQRRR